VPRPRPEHSPRPADGRLRVAAIAVGGSLGTLARYGVERALAGPTLGFPWPTLVVNVVGSFLLGMLVIAMVERWPPSRYARPFAAIGFCGGFTTFSTLVVEADQRAQHGRVGLAAAYVLVSLVAGLLAAAVGMGLARGRLLPAAGDGTFPDPDDVGLLGGDPVPRRPDGRSA
jgi:CrcB protein